MENYEPNKLLPNIIMELNRLENKILGKIISFFKIYKFKRMIKAKIIRTSYSGNDIYEILVFLNTANKLALLKGLDMSEIDFNVFTTSNIFSVVSGYIAVSIPYTYLDNKDYMLKIRYKPTIDGNDSSIEMQWTITNDTSSKNYSSTVQLLDKNHSVDDRLSATKELEYSSAKILSIAVSRCIKLVIKNLKERYVK